MCMLCLGQIDELKGCIEEREEELSRLRTATASVPTCESQNLFQTFVFKASKNQTHHLVLHILSPVMKLKVVSFFQGATDSEKRVLCLSAENESLKQNLSVTQGLLQQLSTIPSQSSTMLMKVRHTGKVRRSGRTGNGWHRRLWSVCAGEWKPAQQNTAAGALLAAALRAAVTPGEAERTERVEERGGAEETRGQGEGATAGVGPREGQGAGGEGTSPVGKFPHTTFIFDQGVFVASVRHPDCWGGIPRHTKAPEQSQTAWWAAVREAGQSKWALQTAGRTNQEVWWAQLQSTAQGNRRLLAHLYEPRPQPPGGKVHRTRQNKINLNMMQQRAPCGLLKTLFFREP